MSFSQINKLFPANHKTIFVLDHTPYFGISCESPIEFEFLKSRPPGMIPMAPISKSLWTSSVESAIEYCRTVWDLFPQGKLVRFIASDTVAHILNTWSPSQQTLSHIMNAMSLIGVPPPHASNHNLEYTVLHGLRAAIEALSECTEIQAEKRRQHVFGDVQTKLINRCRVICITSARDNESMNRLEDIFLGVLQQQNELASNAPHLLQIDHCHLVIINTFPGNIESPVNNHSPSQLSPILTTEVHSIKAPLISNKLSTLILAHYDLASTTVTGIPMREELNASSSANYDVEIYHASAAHTAILIGNALDTAAIKARKEGCEYESVTLKWCTPRGCTGAELHNCTSMHRITPVDVNSRPSLCLINFLLSGRSVMLEMPRKAGGKMTSHLLSAHGGEIFIHTLCTARSVLEDPPSISEGCGGRVTDYRIADFGTLILQNTVLPTKPAFVNERFRPHDHMKTRLTRLTKYWPLTISSTLIFNLKEHIEPLPALITKEKLTEDEVTECKKIINNLMGLEGKSDVLYPINSGQRKGQKRDDQYRMMWTELQTLVKKNLHSVEHGAIYSYLFECHKFAPGDEEKEKVELGDALRELNDQTGTKVDEAQSRASVIRATTDSPMSPPPLANIAAPPTFPKGATTSTSLPAPPATHMRPVKTLLDIFASAQDKTKCRQDFYGRVNNAKLYPDVKNADSGPRGEGMVVE